MKDAPGMLFQIKDELRPGIRGRSLNAEASRVERFAVLRSQVGSLERGGLICKNVLSLYYYEIQVSI